MLKDFYYIRKETPNRVKWLVLKQAYILGVFATRGFTGKDGIYRSAYNRMIKLKKHGTA